MREKGHPKVLNSFHLLLKILELTFAQSVEFISSPIKDFRDNLCPNLMLLPSHDSIKVFTHYRLRTANVTKLFNLLKMLMICIMTRFHRLEAKCKLILFHYSSDHQSVVTMKIQRFHILLYPKICRK